MQYRGHHFSLRTDQTVKIASLLETAILQGGYWLCLAQVPSFLASLVLPILFARFVLSIAETESFAKLCCELYSIGGPVVCDHF